MTAIDISVDGAGISFEADRAGRLRQIGFRPRADDGPRLERGAFPPEAFPLAYPAWGQDVSASPALRLTSHDGRQTCYPVLAGYDRRADDHHIRLTDEPTRLTVDLRLRAYTDGVIEQWTEIRHDQPGPVTLHAAAAAAPVLHVRKPWLTSFHGDWAAEWTESAGPVPIGETVIESFGAVRPCLQASPFVLIGPYGTVREEADTVLAGCLAWGGGIRLAVTRRVGRPDLMRLVCSQQQVGYVLDPGQVFCTPRMIWAWSREGTRPLTHRLHRWVRAHAVRDGERIRPVVFNTWETTYCDFDQARLAGLMSGAGGLGAELFLLDDGWFGAEFPRNDDTAGLGDWEPDPAKLPDGLRGLTTTADQHGLRFGLWVEPEMVNPASRLYRSQPDWVVAEPGRPRREERNQFVLDLCLPAVRSFVTETVGRLLASNPGISYLKWDANRDFSEPGSTALPADRQGNVWIDTVLARWRAMAEVAERWPDIELMLCASGGGRTDLGTLRWFHEVWLSDNTDAVARLRMQWHAARFLPPQLLAAHVTRWGDQDIAFACAVAMGARFGFDLDPAALSPAELAVCRRATQLYLDVRDLVQLGDLFRLIAPDGPGSGGRAALAFSDPSRHRAVVFGYQITAAADEAAADAEHPAARPGDAREPPPPTCPVPWARADRQYRVQQLTLTSADGHVTRSGGGALLADGLPWPLRAARTAVIWLVNAEVS